MWGRWAWYFKFETNFICALYTGILTINLGCLYFIISEMCVFKQTDRQEEQKERLIDKQTDR